MPNIRKNLAVIGGGASGMAAAVAYMQGGGRDAVVIEAQQRIGRKLLSTGNGRCNITNAAITSDSYRTDCPERMKRIFADIWQDGVEGFFNNIGVPIFEEREGRMYPRSETATSVLDMLRFELARRGADILTERRVTRITRKSGAWLLDCGEDTIEARAVIIACGSPANPQLGGCDDSAELAKQLGVSFDKRRPALCPLLCDSPVLPSLKGVRVHCNVSLFADGRHIHTESGELQFNDGNLSGVCVFQLSARLQCIKYREAYIYADLLPDMSRSAAEKALSLRRDTLGDLPLEDFLTGLLNKRVATAVLKNVKLSPLSRRADTLSDDELSAISKALKRLPFHICGVSGWKQAQSAVGGIRLSVLSDRLAVSEKPGLFACGEAVNVNGDCGGFNLHWAWCSGITAGRSALSYLSK